MSLCLFQSLYVICYNCLLFVKQIGMPYSCATLCECVCAFVGEQRIRKCIIKQVARLFLMLVCFLVKNWMRKSTPLSRLSVLASCHMT